MIVIKNDKDLDNFIAYIIEHGNPRIDNRTSNKIIERISEHIGIMPEFFENKTMEIDLNNEYFLDFGRMFRQFKTARDRLFEKGDRQAVLYNIDEESNAHIERVPCILYIQFLKDIDNTISTVANLRSSDVKNKLRKDIFFIDYVRRLCLNEHNHETLYLYLNSAHVYSYDIGK